MTCRPPRRRRPVPDRVRRDLTDRDHDIIRPVRRQALLGAVPGYERTARSRSFPPGTDLTAGGAFLTFHDAAGFAWMRAPDGALTEHPPDEVEDAARAAIGTLTAGTRPNRQEKT